MFKQLSPGYARSYKTIAMGVGSGSISLPVPGNAVTLEGIAIVPVAGLATAATTAAYTGLATTLTIDTDKVVDAVPGIYFAPTTKTDTNQFFDIGRKVSSGSSVTLDFTGASAAMSITVCFVITAAGQI